MIPDNIKAVRHFELERDFLLKKINESKNDDRLYRSIGIAYAGLGMKEQALEAGKKALKILDTSKDAYAGYFGEMDRVRIFIMVKEYDDALIKLDQIIKHHGHWSVELLKLDPFWDPVRNSKKFQEIISNPEYQVNLSGN
jgi:tetratricopeptide (TPR) repeat protein